MTHTVTKYNKSLLSWKLIWKFDIAKSESLLNNIYNLYDNSISNQMSTEKNHAEKDILHINQEGTKKHEQTEMLIGAEVTTKRVSEFISNVSKKFDGCANSTAPSIAMTTFRDAYEDMKSRGVKIRWVTDITKDNLTHCKDLMQYAEVRHISCLNGNFRVSETEYIAATTTKEGLPIPKLIYSNSREMVEQQQYIFETLWAKAVPAEQRIKEIEQEIEPQRIEVVYDAGQALELYQWLIMSAEKEIKVVFPTTNALIRQDKAGILFLLQEAAAVKKCQVKVLMPNDESIRNFIHNNSNISTRFIDQEESGKATILIVDNKVSLVMELKDDSKKTFHEAIGLSTYSNSKAGVLSYVSMFESLWKQTELYEKLKDNEKMQKEFINIAAHELRTPIVPILNLSELLYSNAKGEQRQVQEEQQKEMLEIILRNANRLHQLTENILDVTRIESKTLKLRKERFNLNDVILNVVEDYRKQIANGNGNVKVMYEPGDGITLVEADIQRLIQVISNLLNNAIKFTEEGTVTVITTMERKDDGDGAGGEAEVVVSIKDTGTGINPEIMPRLFTKFATKSYQGTGLGLFIAKSIIEVHGGRMWAENNNDNNNSDRKHKGATFYFTLPVVDMNEQLKEQKNEEGRLVNDQP
jgi:two-component system, OmpR family, sensor histidine kinase VicK